MRSGTSGIIVVALVIAGTASLSAQSAPESLPRISAHDLLAGRAVATTFEALQPLLTGGREVVVTNERGQQRRGRLVSLSADRIVLASPVSSGMWEGMLPLYWPADVAVTIKRRLAAAGQRTLEEAGVTRIDVVDPTGNGTAIGAAVGAAIATGVYFWERGQPDGSLKGLLTAMALTMGIPISTRMGHVIDRAINDPVYQRHSARAQLTLIPVASQDRAAALVAIQW